MSAMFVTYLWHYLAARAIYDDLLRPVTHGHPAPLLAVVLIGVVGFVLGRRSVKRHRR
jgi:hypothetical protein